MADEVRLIAVSKRQPISAIAAAHSAGQIDFGENYLQEALPKIEALQGAKLCWHYIGRIQSNKTQQIAAAFDWVHTVDRGKIAERLSASRRTLEPLGPLNLCLQVNIDQDSQKAGVNVAELPALAERVAGLPALRCRGLMTILDPAADPTVSFARLQTVFEEHRNTYGWDTLSMGMSQDYPAAIRHGATCIRVGTAIFGARPADRSST